MQSVDIELIAGYSMREVDVDASVKAVTKYLHETLGPHLQSVYESYDTFHADEDMFKAMFRDQRGLSLKWNESEKLVEPGHKKKPCERTDEERQLIEERNAISNNINKQWGKLNRLMAKLYDVQAITGTKRGRDCGKISVKADHYRELAIIGIKALGEYRKAFESVPTRYRDMTLIEYQCADNGRGMESFKCFSALRSVFEGRDMDKLERDFKKILPVSHEMTEEEVAALFESD